MSADSVRKKSLLSFCYIELNFQFADKDLFLKCEFQREILYTVLIHVSLLITNTVNKLFFACEKLFFITKISCCKPVHLNPKMCKKTRKQTRQEEKLDYTISKLCFQIQFPKICDLLLWNLPMKVGANGTKLSRYPCMKMFDKQDQVVNVPQRHARKKTSRIR